MFVFEALNAKFGDCLLLHFGDTGAPRLVLIDGGPKGVFADALYPRLQELREERGLDDTGLFKTDLLMVSHIDDDHIHGVIDWLTSMAVGDQNWEISECWFNSFVDVLKRSGKLKTATVDQSNKLAYPDASSEARSIVASVPQGRELRETLRLLGIRVNGGKEILYAPDSVPEFSKGGLKLTLLAPNQKAVERLEQKWESTPAKTAALDNAVENLSSLVVMAESSGASVLLTGDARADFILDGLENAGYMTDGKCHVDILKLPHHGSSRNCTEELFRAVEASHYVISANGKYDNPDTETLCLLASVRGEASEFTIHLTNEPNEYETSPEGKKLFQNLSRAFEQYPWLEARMSYGVPGANVSIDLSA